MFHVSKQGLVFPASAATFSSLPVLMSAGSSPVLVVSVGLFLLWPLVSVIQLLSSHVQVLCLPLALSGTGFHDASATILRIREPFHALTFPYLDEW